jgi:PHD/YefM family antitoxin component YafN of YafNO toxin-antitoxin module
MSTLTIAEAREHLDELCASVAETGEPVLIEHNGRQFIISARSAGLAEEVTRDILSRPDDAENLRKSIERARRGEGVEMTIGELCNRFGIDEARL